jgi:hypothetical protein
VVRPTDQEPHGGLGVTRGVATMKMGVLIVGVLGAL